MCVSHLEVYRGFSGFVGYVVRGKKAVTQEGSSYRSRVRQGSDRLPIYHDGKFERLEGLLFVLWLSHSGLEGYDRVLSIEVLCFI